MFLLPKLNQRRKKHHNPILVIRPLGISNLLFYFINFFLYRVVMFNDRKAIIDFPVRCWLRIMRHFDRINYPGKPLISHQREKISNVKLLTVLEIPLKMNVDFFVDLVRKRKRVIRKNPLPNRIVSKHPVE